MAQPAIETLIKVLLESGPPHLQDKYIEHSDHNRPTGRLQGPRGLLTPSGPGDPHPQGRALDIILFASDDYDRFIADQLVAAFLAQRETMHWSGMVYNRKEWYSDGTQHARVLTKEKRQAILDARKKQSPPNNNEAIDQVAWEHLTHIHIEWSVASAAETAFAESLGAYLKANVVDPGF